MHPAILFIPAMGLLFGPRLWVRHVLKRYDQKDLAKAQTAAEVARELLDRQNLPFVKVECTDIGDHYDPDAKSVRLARDKFDNNSLTAVTTAAHEVGHALQDASNYPPFILRGHLVKVARVAGELGSMILISVPIATLTARAPVPTPLIIIAVLGILGSGVAVQLATLPTEFDASFKKAMPMLKDGYIEAEQLGKARQILFACSLTYVASSLTSVINVWPWIPRRGMNSTLNHACDSVNEPLLFEKTEKNPRNRIHRKRRSRRTQQPKFVESTVRRLGKPLIRGWFKLTRPPTRTACCQGS